MSKSSRQTVLVTGATGTTGSALIHEVACTVPRDVSAFARDYASAFGSRD